MAGITVATLAHALQRADERMRTLEAELNEADSLLGDGDTGVMLARVLGRLAAADLTASSDLGAAFQALARTAAAATGSSLGTLFATALLAAGKQVKGEEEVTWNRLSPLLRSALDAMIQRGKASLGDKTVMDAVHAVADATAGLDAPDEIAMAACSAARQTLDAFKSLPCRIGRARMFGERSVGIDDPGMLGFVRLLEAVAAKAAGDQT